MSNFDLDSGARRFANEIQDVLNRTVCHGITVRAVRADREVFKIGYKISRDDYTVAPVPLTLSTKKPSQAGAVVRRNRQLARDTLRALDRLDAEAVRRGVEK